jgi:ATP-binding cassette subfamily C protein CydC
MKYWFKLIFGEEQKRIVVGVLLAFITAISGVALLLLSGWFITATGLVGISLGLGIIIIFDMYMPGSGIRFFALSRTVSRYIERLYNHNTILKLVAVFRGELFGRLLKLNYSVSKHKDNKEWLSRLTADLDALDSILLRFTITPLAICLLSLAVGIFSYFLWRDSTVLLLGLLTFSLLFGVFGTVFFTTAKAYDKATLQNTLRKKSIEHLEGSFQLHCMGLQTIHAKPMQKELQALNKLEAEFHKASSWVQFILDLFLQLGLVSVILFTLNNAQESIISGPVAVLLILLTVGLIEIVQVLPSQFKEWGKTKYSALKLQSEFSQKNKQIEKSSGTNTAVEYFSVHINNHPFIPASKNGLVLTFAKGTTSFVGRSGSGKSTCANILAGLVSQKELLENQVQYTINGDSRKDISYFKGTDLFYLQQENTIFSDSIRYNLTLGLKELTESELNIALSKVGLADWVKGLPHGLDTWLGETGENLSGGQARRLCLARLFLRKPKFIILDEPFNGIDKMTADMINDELLCHLKGANLAVFTHEISGFYTKQAHTVVTDLNLE